MRTARLWLIAAALSTFAFASQAEEEGVFVQCTEDLKEYCANVTPGDGRIAACLYAHTATLSDSCHTATAGTGTLLEQFFDRLTLAAANCRADIETLCRDTSRGGFYACLKSKKADLSPACNASLGDLAPGS